VLDHARRGSFAAWGCRVAGTNVLDRMREMGLRVTAQRRAIAEAFDGHDVHLTAEEVHRRASQSLPELSLATVYNTLHHMVESGLLAEDHHVPGPTRYDPAPQPHHHLLCRTCHRLEDIDADSVGPVTLDDARRRRFDVESVTVTFIGTCPACRRSDRASA
jgi:Fe2+ or Zn2+ uptake regulation protein